MDKMSICPITVSHTSQIKGRLGRTPRARAWQEVGLMSGVRAFLQSAHLCWTRLRRHSDQDENPSLSVTNSEYGNVTSDVAFACSICLVFVHTLYL